MLRLIAAELRHRRGRALALLGGIAVATASFTVLTGASESSRLEVRGQVAQHFRTAYDVLVRPRGSVSALERRDGLVQQNFLAGSFGGITEDQLRKVRHAPGVEVAAPLAVYGYLMPTADVAVPVAPAPGVRSLYRVRSTWTADRGAIRTRDADSYIYVTRNPILVAPSHASGQPTRWRAQEQFAPGDVRPICPSASSSSSAYSPAARQWLWCWSANGQLGVGDSGPPVQRAASDVGALVRFPFPLLIAGVDPAAEAALSGADRAVVSGRYFRGDEDARHVGSIPPKQYVMPLLAAATTPTDLRASYTIQRLSASAAKAWALAGRRRVRADRVLREAHGTGAPVLRRTVTAADAYNLLLAQMRGVTGIDARWTAGAARYATVGADHVRAVPVKTDRFAWGAYSSTTGTGTGFIQAPMLGRDTGFRAFHEHIQSNSRNPPYYAYTQLVGTFDPAKLAGALDPDVAPLNPFHAPVARAASGSSSWLGDRELAPDGNPAGYLAPPPALLTTMRAGRALLQPNNFGQETSDQAAAPITVIRVRVAGVTGPDKASRERIRLAAEAIAQRTGLQVDVTAGSSPTPVLVDLPASKLGRPAVTLSEGWIKKGVATAILSAVDRKSLVLFLLVLVVCALFCVNATSAAVRSRSVELGVLACVGWPRRQLFAYLLGEVAVIGVAAGIVGLLVALPVGSVLGLPVAGARAALAVPGAAALALIAGAVPAARAARSDPLAAVRPAVRVGARSSARGVGTVGALARVNVARVPGRSVLGVVSLGVGVFALTMLLAVTAAFRGAVVGTVLGDAVAVQVRTADYVAVGACLVLGGLAVADVLYLNLRDRSAEIATLRATGWRERQLTRLVALEGLCLGLVGGVGGALLGMLAAWAFVGSLTGTMPVVAAASALLGVAIAVGASLPPAAALRGMPTATLLAEE